MARAYNVIDADGHILEPLDLWDRYIDPKFRERRPRFVIDENGKERLSVEGKLLGNPRGIGSLGSVGVRQGIVKAGTLKYAEGRKGGFDPHARIVDMDADGIDAAFLYPSLGLFAGAVEDPGLAAAMCRAYNRWLADYCKPYPERLFGVAMLPMQSVELAVDEMRYAREKLGMRGGWIAPWLDRMDRHFDDQGFNESAPKMRPSELFQRNCWISFEPVESSIAVLADYIGANKIMWATDYPHQDGFFPGAPQMVRDRLGSLSPEARHQA